MFFFKVVKFDVFALSVEDDLDQETSFATMASEDAFWPQRYIEDLRGSAALRPPGKLVPRKMGRGGPSPAQIILSENVRRWR